MTIPRIAILGLLAATVTAAGPAMAQTQIPVCGTQEQLEQLIRDQGRIIPDGCRKVSITAVESQSGPLCAIDTAASDPGIIGSLRQAATDTRWWTACENLRPR
ncbi:hypothetical protein HL658_00085 [Azospirillum sp. RWY-5-1]|uniref:Secreted protein n=1 Tax=Azospirillum oleiclasticum TaxID=2735135 RepID=A0ABX2T1B6_9PROT|nr:hypothetical protein [Azospirillum oleiclasticum]NYZ10930.1 hypothetical protein [Azospirillum oleiclasticum]NYZ18092.1 hypothetical protein [Azospirillum oleiclasticum]